jgi:5-methyltetrahydrofolate--homocysteine methyltransferase
MKSALAILNLAENRTGELNQSKGVVLLATVQGDVHDIGKTIVGAMLTASGYEVTDLGADVKNETIVDSVRAMRPSVLGLSALLTTTIKEQRTIIALLEQEDLRSQVKIVVGGAPANSSWAESISADGYADTGIAAVRLVDRLLYGKEGV